MTKFPACCHTEWGVIQSRLKANNKKRNNATEIPIRQVNAVTVRLVFPASRTRKIRPLARDSKMTNMAIKTIVLVNICYTRLINIEKEDVRVCLV